MNKWIWIIAIIVILVIGIFLYTNNQSDNLLKDESKDLPSDDTKKPQSSDNEPINLDESDDAVFNSIESAIDAME